MQLNSNFAPALAAFIPVCRVNNSLAPRAANAIRSAVRDEKRRVSAARGLFRPARFASFVGAALALSLRKSDAAVCVLLLRCCCV
jgi:hypothetical protein